MTNFIGYYEYSKLASAAYADLSSLDGATIAKATDDARKLPETLANQTFVATATNQNVWTVSPGGYYGNDSEGFAATLFSRAGEKVLAIRGTEPDRSPSGDLLKADLGQIGFLGLAMGQALSMVNYIRRLQAGTDSNVQQLTWAYSTKPPAGQSISIGIGKGYIYLTAMKSEKGLGLLAPGEKINVTGHSLGGHLAALAARLFPQLISESYTFNAPGFDPSTANGVVGVVSSLLSPVLGVVINTTGGAALKLTDEFVGLMSNYLSPPPASSFAQIIIHNLESEDIAPGNDGSGVASVLTGTHNLPQEILIPTERNSHMIEPFMDSLSMQALLYRLKPDITTAQIESLFRAVSTGDGDVLEKLVTSLRDSLIGKGAPLGKIADARDELAHIGTGDIGARRDYYQVLLDLEKIVKAYPNIGLEILSGAVSTAAARNDFGQFLALIHLTPFALKTTDATALAALKNANPSLAQAWEADAGLSAAQRAAGLGHYSDLWLADRAAMLSWMLDANRDNQTFIKSAKVGDEAWSFRDVDSGGSILVLPEKPLSSTAPHHYVTFGGSGNDALSGADLADHLYGGDGNDTLTGHGGAGRDLLLGACTRVAAHPSYAPLM